MEPFVRLDAVAAPLAGDNVDTDIIFPARFLLLMECDGLGRYAFHDRRFDAADRERPDFVLNQPPFRDAGILIAGANFGCGSSREQAVWALRGFGIRCVIAPGFGEIFLGNCYKNGVLPIVLAAETVAALALVASAGSRFVVDLVAMTLSVEGGPPLSFAIEAGRRTALLNGWDETEMILNADGAAISRFEARQSAVQPWLYPDGLPVPAAPADIRQERP